MAVLLDSRPVAAVVIAAIDVALGGTTAKPMSWDAASLPGGNRVAGTLPNIYALTRVYRRFDDSAARIGASQYVTSWRVVVQCAGTTVKEAAWALSNASAALEDVFISTADLELICKFEAAESPTWDDGRFVGSVTFTAAT